ncbi:MAG: alcohol dehydrogenase [Verrucomicrobiales bacterium]|nr:alcohol dehydrogenase [Verrucomicrobiales bacterium]
MADDWPQWRGPNRDGISQEKGWATQWPAEGPKQIWKAGVGVGYSSMSVAKDRVFTMGNVEEVDNVYCLDAKTGKELWKHSYPCSSKDPNGYPGPRCTPTVDGKFVYTVSRDGQLFCLKVSDGNVVWKKNYKTDYDAKVPQWGFSTSPLVEKNMLIVEIGSSGASVVAFDKTSGKELWKSGDDKVGYSSPVAFNWKGQRDLAILSANGIVGRSAKDGHELWRHEWKTMYDVNAATPIVSDDKVFISSGYNAGCALVQFSTTPPKVVWQNKEMRNHVNSCVLWKGFLYGFDEKELKCIEFGTGTVKWSEGIFGKGSVIVANGKLIIYSDNGRLATAEATSNGYKEISTAQVLGGKTTLSLPVLANGRIYCRSLENLIALDVAGK